MIVILGAGFGNGLNHPADYFSRDIREIFDHLFHGTCFMDLALHPKG